jgi:hypothetical protein
MRPLFLALLLLCTQHGLAHAADIYGYIDSKGVAHFAAEKIDERYQIFFRRGQSFDTTQGVTPFGRGGRKLDGKVPQASQTLLALFEASPSYKTAKAALRDAADKHSIDYELLQALIATESGFDAQAVSPKGAMGLMQLMPATARELGVADPFHPDDNIRGGVSYLASLMARYDQNVELALAAYNAGPGAVQRYGGIPPYAETQAYVRKVMALVGGSGA